TGKLEKEGVRYVAKKLGYDIDTENYYVSRLKPDGHIYKANINDYLYAVAAKTTLFFNKTNDPNCRGIILYDSDDYHYMLSIPRQNYPYFTVNQSVGSFLSDNADTTTLSGYANQEYLKETTENPGAVGYNVRGNISIDKSPDDTIAIISNRFDGMWGQTPGDSGVGTAIVLGIAKYFKDYNIKPKYNLTFLFTTAEEYGLLGMKHYSDNHSDDNIKYWLILDQLAFDQNDAALCTYYNNTSYEKIVETIIDDTRYYERTGYNILPKEGNAPGSEQVVASKRGNCDSFCMVKDQDYRWDHWHRTGRNFNEGDCLNNTDREDVNVTTELAWGIIKYFLVNPNCRFNGSVTYTAVDSPDDTDALNDSINASVSITTTLPHDRVRINAIMKDASTNNTVFWKNFDFDVNSSGITKVLTLTIPPSSTGSSSGNYRLWLELYNSTGRIDDIIDTGNYNDTDMQSGSVYLYSRGNSIPNKPNDITGPNTLQVLEEGDFSTITTDSNKDQLQYQWEWEPDDREKVGPLVSCDYCNVSHTYYWRGTKEIKVRARDDFGYLFDGSTENWNRFSSWSSWSDSFYVTVRFLNIFGMSCTILASPVSSQSASSYPSILTTNSQYNAMAFGGIEPYDYEWDFGGRASSQQKIANYGFIDLGNKTVSLNVTDSDGVWEKVSITVKVVNLSASYNSSKASFSYPYETIVFNDTSAVRSDYHIANWTWDFDDGNVSYNQHTNHSFEEEGTYNVTLTITDNQSGTDVYYKIFRVGWDYDPPEITNVSHSPDTVGFGSDVYIGAKVIDNVSGVDTVSINVTYPDNSTGNYSMFYVVNDTYCYIFNDTWQNGNYQYSIYAVNGANNTNVSSGHNFTVSAQATMSVCTLKDNYGPNEYINLTDPPMTAPPPLGYELLNDNQMLHIWNRFDSYYFN
ncbi:MAG: M28 family peptidase, partial [Candidatus Thermoplasmatota archaeon]|nr:M28 family peptidase [Candidatus Thermoplasmatota archaeon]